ncbi:MAG: DUF3810 domain-containing protein [Chitinophagaceae bacterium]|nr:MAG: DUF3810 domain-containing protein [Chitinophagaceae bacterium]
MSSKSVRKTLLTSIMLFGIALLIYVVELFPEVILKFYSNGIYQVTSVTQRFISSIFPLALGDILYFALIIVLLRLSYKFFSRVKKTGWKKSDRVTVPLTILNTGLLFFISFKLLWGLNYARPTINKQLNIGEEKYTVQNLVTLGNYFINRVNMLEQKKTPNLAYNVNQLREQSVLAYKQIASKNSFFEYRSPSVKRVTSDWLTSQIGIEGYYNPLSAEANLNMKLPSWVLPFVSCHEIAHQLGVAKEDEANLVAYLVGKDSTDANLQYSVNYNMLRYILLEIRIKSPEDYVAMREKINKGVINDFKAESEFWAQYDSQMSEYMSMAFDKFLKLNKQKSGIKSYQNIVIWLWNIHKDELAIAK